MINSKTERYEEVLTIVQNIIADLTGNELEDVDPTSDLENDLNINELDFKRIVNTLNLDFNISLTIDEVLEEAETVEELSILVQEESELG